MYKIDNSTAATTLPAPTTAGTPGYYTDGNPGTGVPATVVPAEHLNMMMMEIINVVLAGGLTLDKAVNTQLRDALTALGLRAASTAQTGVSQLADSATAQGLTDATKVLTPATLAAALQGSNQSFAINGFQILPGGLILQWGRTPTVVAANTSYTASFPMTFPNNCLSIVGVFSNTLSPSSFYSFNINSTPAAGSGTASQYKYSSSNSGTQALWVAIGN